MYIYNLYGAFKGSQGSQESTFAPVSHQHCALEVMHSALHPLQADHLPYPAQANKTNTARRLCPKCGAKYSTTDKMFQADALRQTSLHIIALLQLSTMMLK